MRKWLQPWLLPALLGACASATPSSVGASGWAGVALREPVSPRAEAVGREVACLETGPMAAWGNVGGLGLSRGVQVAGSRARVVPELQDDAHLSFGSGLVCLPMGSRDHLVLNASATRLSYGWSVTEPNLYDGPRPDTYENVYGLAAGFGVGERLGFGAGIKWLHDFVPAVGFGDDGRDGTGTTGPLFDLGALGRIPVGATPGAPQFTLGAALHNMGPRARLAPDVPGEMLPHVARGAVGLEWRRHASLADESPARRGIASRYWLTAFTVELGLEKSLDSNPWMADSTYAVKASYLARHDIVLGGGAEVKLFDLLALRAGYLHDEPGMIKDYTWGFGLDAHHVAGFDFASVPQPYGRTYGFSRVKKFSLWLRLPFGQDA